MQDQVISFDEAIAMFENLRNQAVILLIVVTLFCFWIFFAIRKFQRIKKETAASLDRFLDEMYKIQGEGIPVKVSFYKPPFKEPEQPGEG